MFNVCYILLLIVALRLVAPKLVSPTHAMKKYFYSPVDAVFVLVSTIVNLFFKMMNFFTQAVISGVSDAIRWVVRNLILLGMAFLFFYFILLLTGFTVVINLPGDRGERSRSRSWSTSLT
jgi:hypothetical protein